MKNAPRCYSGAIKFFAHFLNSVKSYQVIFQYVDQLFVCIRQLDMNILDWLLIYQNGLIALI